MRDHSNTDAINTTNNPTEKGCSFGVTQQQMANSCQPISDNCGQDSETKHVTPYLSSSLSLQQQTYLSHMGQPSLVNIIGGMISTNSTNTVISSTHQYLYGYNSSNSNVDGSGGYQHGTTGTNNSALSQSAGHQGQGLTSASASGIGQYQHYPYHPNSTDSNVANSSVNVISPTMSTFASTNGSSLSQQETNCVKKDLNQEISANDPPTSSVSHPHTAITAPEQQQQEHVPYYSGAQYGYNSSNSNMDGSGGYQHGTTGTNNSALSQSARHQQDPELTAASSGMEQYQQYPYDPANPHAPSDQILQSVSTPVIAPSPVGVVPTNAVTGKTTVTTSYSNLEVLTILDTSDSASIAGALPDKQLSESLLSSVNKRETTTLTKSTTKVLAISPSSTSNINNSATTSTESYEIFSNDLFSGEGITLLEGSPIKKAKLGK